MGKSVLGAVLAMATFARVMMDSMAKLAHKKLVLVAALAEGNARMALAFATLASGGQHASLLPVQRTVIVTVNAPRRANVSVNLALLERPAQPRHALTAPNTGLATRRATNASALTVMVAPTAQFPNVSVLMAKFAVV